MSDDGVADLLQRNDVKREVDAAVEDGWQFAIEAAADVERAEAEWNSDG